METLLKSMNHTIKYMEAGVFEITLWATSKNGCTDKYVLSPGITVEPAGEVRFSTVFTPNMTGPIDRTDLPTGGTEIDQFFFPPIREKVTEYKLQIFNRLGVLIFQSDNINKPWNGYYKGQLCAQGVYIWYVEGKICQRYSVQESRRCDPSPLEATIFKLNKRGLYYTDLVFF